MDSKYEGDKIIVTFHLAGGQIDLYCEYEVYSWIGDHPEVAEALAAKRMGWA